MITTPDFEGNVPLHLAVHGGEIKVRKRRVVSYLSSLNYFEIYEKESLVRLYFLEYFFFFFFYGEVVNCFKSSLPSSLKSYTIQATVSVIYMVYISEKKNGRATDQKRLKNPSLLLKVHF